MEKTDKLVKQSKTLAQTITEFCGYVVGNIKKRTLKEWIAYGKQSLKDYIEEIKLKAKDLKKTNFELGLYHYFKGNLSDARFRFKYVKFFWNDIPECDYFMGRTFYLEKRFAKAQAYLNDYIKSGDLRYIDEAKYCLDTAARNKAKIEKIPLNIVRENFNIYSGFYNQLVEANFPDSPQFKLSQVVIKHLNALDKPKVNKVLDMGCGTGLVGKQLRATGNINYMTGIDLADQMLDEAKVLTEGTGPVYNETVNLDIEQYFDKNAKKEKFDIFIASSLLNYYSNPDKLFENCAKLAVPKALLAFTFRTHEQTAAKLFDEDTEEFTYSSNELKQLQARHGWEIIDEGELTFLNGAKGMHIIAQLK